MKEVKSLLPVILFMGVLSGCHKSTESCEQTMSAIAGQYKITRYERVTYGTGAVQDVTFYLTGCQLSGIYTLSADSTIIYQEQSNCTDSGAGRWRIESGGFYTEFNSGGGRNINLTTIVSWDCTNLVLISHYPNANFNDRFTLTRL